MTFVTSEFSSLEKPHPISPPTPPARKSGASRRLRNTPVRQSATCLPYLFSRKNWARLEGRLEGLGKGGYGGGAGGGRKCKKRSCIFQPCQIQPYFLCVFESWDTGKVPVTTCVQDGKESDPATDGSKKQNKKDPHSPPHI